MTVLQPLNIAQLAKHAGFSDESLVIAVAIALAESGGDTEAKGENGPTDGCPNGSLDRGLWQINNCYHPDVSDLCAYTPQCNADKAYAISNQGTNFHPWSTFLNGAYQQHLDIAQQAITELNSQPDPIQDATNQANSLDSDTHDRLQRIEKDLQYMKSNPIRPPTPLQHHYHVVQGDTLWGIAVKFYGDGNKWHQIYDANKVLLGSNPNILKAGITLILP